MYKVISANRGPQKPPKNWRVFEKESLEKYFGKVLDVNGEDGFSVFDAYKKYKNDVEYIPNILTIDYFMNSFIIYKNEFMIGGWP